MTDIAIRFATVRWPAMREISEDATDTTDVATPPPMTELEDLVNTEQSFEKRQERVRSFRQSTTYLQNQPHAADIRSAAERLERQAIGGDTRDSIRQGLAEVSEIIEANPNSNTSYDDPLENLAWSTYLAGSLVNPVDIDNVKAAGRLIRLSHFSTNDEGSTDPRNIRIQLPASFVAEQKDSVPTESSPVPDGDEYGAHSRKKQVEELETAVQILRESLDARFRQYVEVSKRRRNLSADLAGIANVSTAVTTNLRSDSANVSGRTDEKVEAQPGEPWVLTSRDIVGDNQLLKSVLGRYGLKLEQRTVQDLVDRLLDEAAAMMAELAQIQIHERLAINERGRVYRKRSVNTAEGGNQS